METAIIIAATILAFAIFFVVFFQTEVRAAIGRVQKIGKDGVSLKETRMPNQEERPVPFEQQFDAHSRSPVQVKREEQIRAELTHRGLVNDEEKVKLLIRALATNIIQSDCERTSLLIFGTQLELLVEINSRNQGMKLSDIRQWYVETVQPNHPGLVEYPFEDFVGFLYRQGIAKLEGDAVKVTEFGVEFLQYLVRTGQTHRRSN